jgi:hypothetical protein
MLSRILKLRLIITLLSLPRIYPAPDSQAWYYLWTVPPLEFLSSRAYVTSL